MKTKKQVNIQEVSAEAKYVRISASKIRFLINDAYGKNPTEVSRQLERLPHKGARLLNKVLKSVMANAVNNHKLNIDDCVITLLAINEAPTQKRYRNRAKGRIFSIIKRSSHIRVKLGIKE